MATVRLTPTLTLLRHAPFRHQFLANATSMLGSAITPVALTLGVMNATGSVADLGLVLGAYSLAQVVFILAGGVWADRFSRQHLMMLADGLRIGTQVTFGVLLLTGHAELWAMVLLQAVCGAATALFQPASVGLVTATALPGFMQEANALLALTRNLSLTLGPLAAGTLVLTAGAGWALILDGVTFAGSLYFLMRLNLPPRPKTSSSAGFFAELGGGWREVVRRNWVWTSIVYFMIFNLAFASIQVIGPAIFADQRLGGLKWGAVMAGLAGGQFVGNAVAVWFRPRRILAVGRILMVLAVPLLAVLDARSPLVLLLAASVLAGVAISLPDTLWDTALQEHIPGDALSRVSSFDYAGSLMLRPAGIALAAAVSGVFGQSQTLRACAVVVLVATVLSLLSPQVRRLGRSPEPADAMAA